MVKNQLYSFISEITRFKTKNSPFPWKHVLHCITFTSFLIWTVFSCYINFEQTTINPWKTYGVVFTLFLYFIRFQGLLGLPQMIFHVCGLLLYDTFPEKVKVKPYKKVIPFVCFRVVTRGNFPTLIKENLERNFQTCTQAGLKRFQFEIVTDNPINLPSMNEKIREIVVPSSYKTRTGALYKARALQYCLEDDVNQLNGQDWIVHLDEETLLTENSVNGIVNFIQDGRHCLGQGLITYANENVVNWWTTLADNFRVSDDLGKLRFQFKVFHKPYFNMKGSFVVAQVHAERRISFDNGPDGSIAEDCFFAMRAMSLGYTFNFIEGEMFEKSPFTIMDFVRQRKRWFQGVWLVSMSQKIPMRSKFCLIISTLVVAFFPLLVIDALAKTMFPIPYPFVCTLIGTLCGNIGLYMHLFGLVKSYSVYDFGLLKLLVLLICTYFVLPINFVIESVAVVWGILDKKKHFDVVEKEIKTKKN